MEKAHIHKLLRILHSCYFRVLTPLGTQLFHSATSGTLSTELMPNAITLTKTHLESS